jgi:hypothetical protein
MSTPSTSSLSMRCGGRRHASSRARTRRGEGGALDHAMVFVEGLALGSGGGIRSSRSEKPKRLIVKGHAHDGRGQDDPA